MRSRSSKWHLMLVVAIGVVGGITWYAVSANSAAEVPREGLPAAGALPAHDSAARVATIKPQRGGIQRTTNQPGSVIAYESASLFAKVSGYLKSQSVDIGDHVRRGQVLAEIDSPELIRDVEIADAALSQAKAQVLQADARVTSELAAHDAAVAAIAQAEAEIGHTKAVRDFREKQYNRIKDLFEHKSIDGRLVDEKLDEWESASAADQAAHAAIVTAKAMAAAAQARVAQARADAAEARAKVRVAEAELAKAKVLSGYLQIVSPYDGVVTERNFFRGDFIAAADQSSDKALLGIARTDLVRVVVQIPDADIPLLDVQDQADIAIDALPGTKLTGKVSRFAHAEDENRRLMRAEIDLPNNNEELHPGMYGRVVIHLSSDSGALRVPASCLHEQTSDGLASLYVVQDGKAQLRQVRVGKDNGAQVEILDGLEQNDDVVVHQDGQLNDKASVRIIDAPGDGGSEIATDNERS